MPFATTIGDSLLEGAGGFSTTLGFWWHICFPDEVVQHTLGFKTNNDDGMLVLINILEFVMVITTYCAALHIGWTSPITAPYASHVRGSPHHHGSQNDMLNFYYNHTTRQHSLPPPQRGRGGLWRSAPALSECTGVDKANSAVGFSIS